MTIDNLSLETSKENALPSFNHGYFQLRDVEFIKIPFIIHLS